ncbi:MAG: sigma-70 family RNA polymerase sigma factor [Oricola sp.]|jgi:RNA polymerase sigma factor (sigma-70 family)|nr:sigma-70 family RNA polymerase sigma factor [Oricola sp.]
MAKATARIFDEYLAASARAGDRAAFGLLAERWQPKLLAHAYRLLGEREAARDAVQDAWADIAKGLGRLDDVRVFPAWAYRIVTRRAADVIRVRQRDRKLGAAYAAEQTTDAQGVGAIEAVADAGPLNAAMAALPPEQRAAVALFYIEDFSVAEVAAAMGVPAGTVKTRLMHARRKLRAALEGGESHG